MKNQTKKIIFLVHKKKPLNAACYDRCCLICLILTFFVFCVGEVGGQGTVGGSLGAPFPEGMASRTHTSRRLCGDLASGLLGRVGVSCMAGPGSGSPPRRRPTAAPGRGPGVGREKWLDGQLQGFWRGWLGNPKSVNPPPSAAPRHRAGCSPGTPQEEVGPSPPTDEGPWTAAPTSGLGFPNSHFQGPGESPSLLLPSWGRASRAQAVAGEVWATDGTEGPWPGRALEGAWGWGDTGRRLQGSRGCARGAGT